MLNYNDLFTAIDLLCTTVFRNTSFYLIRVFIMILKLTSIGDISIVRLLFYDDKVCPSGDSIFAVAVISPAL